MNILVTGAAGFIGSHLMDALRPDGVGFDNFLTGSRENYPAWDIDIVDRREVFRLANEVEPELVIHCAASYSNPDLWHRDTQINVEGGINAALVAKYHQAHLVYFQTILPPVSSYAISKLASEQYLRLSQVPLTVFRMANIYGPRNISGPIPVFYKRITEGKPCVVVDTTREMVFIDDLVQLVLHVAGERITGTFDVCTGKKVPIMELYAGVAAELGHDEVPPLIPPDPDDVQGHVYPYRGVPGWKATTPLREGIAKTVTSYREQGVTDTHTHLRLKG